MIMIRSVIVGCAHMHVNEVALYIKEQPSSELCGVADVPSEEPEICEKRYTRGWNIKNVESTCGARIFDDYRRMLDEVKPDVAYVLCENYRKVQVTEEIAKRGIDVIIEKPMAVTAADAGRIIDLKEKYKVNIFVNWPVAWRKSVRDMEAAVKSGVCGDILKLRYLNGHTGPLGKGAKHRGVTAVAEEMTDEERSRTWWYNKKYGGGAYADILCYGCYFTRLFFGKTPTDIMSRGLNLNTPCSDAEDNVAAIMRFENGLSVIEGSWTTPRIRIPTGPEAICTDGVVWCDGKVDDENYVTAADISGNSVELEQRADDPNFRNMPWQYAAYKEQGIPVHESLTAEFNADIADMLEAAEKSNISGTAEKIER